MICKSCIRSVIVQAGHLLTLSKARVRLSNSERVCLRANPWNREFRTSLRMMVDTGGEMEEQASIVDLLPEKDSNKEYTSGRWKSEDGKLSCGYTSFRGKRATMEDFHDAKMTKVNGQPVCLFGIFDGHGGSRAAQYLKEHLFENLMKHPQFITDTKLAIRFHTGEMFLSCPSRTGESYQQTDAEFLDSERDTYRDDGSTASTAVLVGNHLYVANVGDSRTVISKAGKAIPLSEDHKPNRSDERKRIENAGGVVMWAGTWRVGGVLAMSRAFGNRLLKQFVVAEPEIQDLEVDEDFEFLVLASDGLWDVLPNEVAIQIARTEDDPEAAAQKLTTTAFSRGSADNITCIVVKFHHDKGEPARVHHDEDELAGADHDEAEPASAADHEEAEPKPACADHEEAAPTPMSTHHGKAEPASGHSD